MTKPRLIELFRAAIRSRHYSRRTEKSYWYWIRCFIRFHGMRHPAQMGAGEVTAFLSWLATERDVAAATQNQALSALLFLYQKVLEQELPWLDELVRAKRPLRLPVVLSETEVARLLGEMHGAQLTSRRAAGFSALKFSSRHRQEEKIVSSRGFKSFTPRAARS
ncbi:MAG: phage integrase N-terminal SAM-like domain-containing protein [Burkholderiales bacterium]